MILRSYGKKEITSLILFLLWLQLHTEFHHQSQTIQFFPHLNYFPFLNMEYINTIIFNLII